MATQLGLRPKQITLALATILAATVSLSAAPRNGASTSDSESAPSKTQPTSKAADPGQPKSPESPASPVAAELEELRETLQTQAQQFAEHSQELDAERTALREQLERIAALETQLGIAPDPGASSTAEAELLPGTGPVAVPSIPAPDQDISKRLDNIESKLKGFGPFTFAGDFRLRDEPYFGGPTNQSQVRDRERYRARLNINAKLNSDISGGLTLATGDFNDPITNNQTANQDFTRKPFFLDKAFINYNPHQFSALTLIGGKFAYPWYRTELTWDNDISPEGVAQKLEWKSDTWHVLRQFALVGFELPFGESTKLNPVTTFTSNPPNALLPYPNSGIKQSIVYGGQIQTRWQLASWLSFTADTAFYDFHNADQILLANQVAYGSGSAGSAGLGEFKLAGNTVTNSFQTITESFVVPVSTYTPPGGGASIPCVVNTPAGNKCTTTVASYIVGAKFNSKFALSDTIAQFDIKTPSERWPIRLLADYVQNIEACANDSTLAFTPAQLANFPVDATLTHATKNPSITKSGAADPLAVNGCNSHDRRGHWLEARFGRQQEKGDFQFAYTHMLIEREAVLSDFNFSDIRQGSDVLQNRVEAFYQANRNVQFGFTGFIGRPLHPTVTTPQETYLKRLQFDVIYKF
ncbi:MAG TPA: putative porin [Candidatus Acidoferrales bacterium]|nr:putative porin [Candidatus Acidoferrales bacterium]